MAHKIETIIQNKTQSEQVENAFSTLEVKFKDGFNVQNIAG